MKHYLVSNFKVNVKINVFHYRKNRFITMKITRPIGFYVIEFGIPLYLYLFIEGMGASLNYVDKQREGGGRPNVNATT